MSLLQTLVSKPFSHFLVTNPNPNPNPNPKSPLFFHSQSPNSCSKLPLPTSPHPNPHRHPLLVASATSSPKDPPSSDQNPNPNPARRSRRPSKPKTPPENEPTDAFPMMIPRKARRGRRSEAAAVEDFVRESLERTFASIRKQSAEILDGKEEVLKERVEEEESDCGDGTENGNGRVDVVEEEDPDWPVDADVGWGIRASEYFEKHPIKNVVVDGVEIDWEGEIDEGWVKEINCLEWESFAFHPSPLVVLVFERYNRAADNWKLLKELEKAAQVYWNAKDRLPPRTVKIDINIEKDLAYALKVKECPQLLFLKGNRILYREKEMRTADELVHMIAHFYYNAKKPSWVDPAAVAPSV